MAGQQIPAGGIELVLAQEITEDKTAELICQLHESGMTYKEIADNVGVHLRTIMRWGKGTHKPIHAPLINTGLQHLLTVKKC